MPQEGRKRNAALEGFRSFLLFYGPIVSRGILAEEHYTHFIFLSEAIFILLGDSITYKELEQAERLLQHFCLMFSALYSEGKETINVHQFPSPPSG